MNSPCVSVIIPTYNRSKMVTEAIRSVLAQDYSDFEVIVVDDGSIDDTAEIIKQLSLRAQAKQSPVDINYIHTDHRGVSAARNVGIERAHGGLIAFLDSDDLWLPDKLMRQMKYFEENPDINVCQTEEVWIRNGRRVNPRRIHKKHSGWIFEQCIPRCIVSPSAVMLKKEVFDDIGLFDEKMPLCEDYDLWLRVSPKYPIITLPERLIIKRGGHPDQLSSEPLLDVWRIYALEKVLNMGVGDTRLAGLVREDICRRATIVAEGAKKRGNSILVDCCNDILLKHALLSSKTKVQSSKQVQNPTPKI